MSEILKFDLIIVGGGCSGLSTALHLLKQNFLGTIGLIEARDRLGGRIWTSKTKIEEKKIEIGANWIHGIINNPIYELLYRKRIIDSSIESNKSVYNIQAKICQNGNDVDTVWIRKVYEAYSTILKGTTRFCNDGKLEEIKFYKDSMGKYIENEVNKWIETEIDSESNFRPIVRSLFKSLIKRETCISGCNSLDDVSLQYFDQYKEYLGPHITIPLGYDSLINVLLNDIEEIDNDQNRFHYFLDSPIKQIQWPGLTKTTNYVNDNVDSKNIADTFPIRIESSNGTIYECEHLVLTLTLGCLKKYAHNLFDPPLPEYKIDCIKRMGIDIVDKIFMEYSSKSTIFDAFTKDGDTIDEIMLLWDENGDDDQPIEETDTIQTKQQPWYKKIYSIYRISDHCIQLWVSGKEAEIAEKMNENEINDQLTEQFRRIFKNSNFPRADNVIITRWGMDQYSLGSYSFISKDSSPDDIEKLSKPIYLRPNDELPAIVFSGEATHKEYFSTVHGAFLSGIDAAKNFITQKC
ncbi:peroxisomal N(1)-acetyl-spermine/spermidine oxidase-like [Dermatophagoides pteronyssinus]|uniref:peroxisomal N(1)-acetyl-spermine/spermidine oxidase-like n=1 Tax=Dermatophagoides pteronyssinus TaxID=6956 RepID=UPI003F67D9C1